MTGAYLRVKRQGKWESIEVEHLTDDERALIFAYRDKDDLMMWVDMLCRKLRENEQILDELVEDGLLERA